MPNRSGEIAVLGLGRSGEAVARLLARGGARVYASDLSTHPEIVETAQKLNAEGIAAESGGHDLDRIAQAAAVVVSPGVPPDALPLRSAKEGKQLVLSEIEVALKAMPGVPYIGVTGTNGKTTVTALIAHLLRALGYRTAEGGNIGVALSDVALQPERPAWLSIELSSFQLHDTPSVKPAVAVITNLAPDHLDRYEQLEDYYADKMLILRNADSASVRVVNGDDEDLLKRSKGAPGREVRFSLTGKHADAWYDRERELLMLDDAPLMERGLLALLGDHNVANALAAALAVWSALPNEHSGTVRAKIAVALQSFKGIPHRMEIVGERDGVLWINDSKATNVGAARVALQGTDRPTILLLGGKHKGEPYTALLDAIEDKVKLVVAYGEAAEIISNDLDDFVAVERVGSSFEEVIACARAHAESGDVVLLAPACSSYDMFANYEERGAEFRRLALPE